uniref:Uncharacterized protein n=1 Tax=Rhodnius prolixus TaxID=13249 RepID=A0A0G2KBG3_RHOPR
TGKQALLK